MNYIMPTVWHSLGVFSNPKCLKRDVGIFDEPKTGLVWRVIYWASVFVV